MIEAFGENVVMKAVKKEDEETTKSGIILVSDFDTELPRAEIIHKGPDVAEWVNIGDIVIYSEQYTVVVKSNDEEYVVAPYKILYGKEV